MNEPDPEVVADLRLRAATQHDSTRQRGEGVYAWRKPDDVGAWKCRGGCGTLVGVTEDVMAQYATFNGYLRKKLEAPLNHDAIVLCDRCRARMEKERSHRLHEKVEKLRGVIQALKAHKEPRKAVELLQQLKDYKHPDPQGLLDAIDARRSTSGDKAKRERRSSL